MSDETKRPHDDTNGTTAEAVTPTSSTDETKSPVTDAASTPASEGGSMTAAADDTANQTSTPQASASAPTTSAEAPQAAAPTATSTSPAAGSPANSNLILIALALLVAAAAAAGYYYYNSNLMGAADEQPETLTLREQFNLPQSDGGPVARVDGVEITNREFNRQLGQLSQQAQMQGADISDPLVQSELPQQALEMLVNTKLLLAEAEANVPAIEEAEIDERYNAFAEQFGGEAVLIEQLDAGGSSVDEFRENIRQDLLLSTYIEAEVPIENFVPSDEEIEAFYNEVAATNPSVPPLEQVRPQVAEQLQAQEQQEAISGILAELRAEADIEDLLLGNF